MTEEIAKKFFDYGLPGLITLCLFLMVAALVRHLMRQIAQKDTELFTLHQARQNDAKEAQATILRLQEQIHETIELQYKLLERERN